MEDSRKGRTRRVPPMILRRILRAAGRRTWGGGLGGFNVPHRSGKKVWPWKFVVTFVSWTRAQRSYQTRGGLGEPISIDPPHNFEPIDAERNASSPGLNDLSPSMGHDCKRIPIGYDIAQLQRSSHCTNDRKRSVVLLTIHYTVGLRAANKGQNETVMFIICKASRAPMDPGTLCHHEVSSWPSCLLLMHLTSTTQLRGVCNCRRYDSQRAIDITSVIHVSRNASTWSGGDTRLTTRAILDIRSELAVTETREHASVISYYVLEGMHEHVWFPGACQVVDGSGFRYGAAEDLRRKKKRKGDGDATLHLHSILGLLRLYIRRRIHEDECIVNVWKLEAWRKCNLPSRGNVYSYFLGFKAGGLRKVATQFSTFYAISERELLRTQAMEIDQSTLNPVPISHLTVYNPSVDTLRQVVVHEWDQPSVDPEPGVCHFAHQSTQTVNEMPTPTSRYQAKPIPSLSSTSDSQEYLNYVWK
ncbi:hypothetical protein EV401DRAFT_2193586 [Pisolithus croceorrhizus]|nr:hypothetical protein EV401DRAFT_2193586 [Pisolithus croceorrhizus]